MRTYRVSRVRSARISEESFVRPPDFDLAAYWEQASADFVAGLPRYPVTLRVPSHELPLIYRIGGRVRVGQASEPDGEGCVIVHLVFDTEAEACGCVLSFGANAEIVEPEALRERVIELAQRVLRRSGGQAATVNGVIR